jgi:hypothetical protein
MSGGLDDRRNAFFARWPVGHINNSLRNALGNPMVASSVTAELCDIDERTVCRVMVKPALHGAWCEIDGNDVFYVRNGNQTVKVRNRDVADYLATRT